MIPRIVWTSSGFVRTNDIRVKTAVVCFANGPYTQVAPRLLQSIERHNPGLKVFLFDNFADIGSPPHSEQPYAFKFHAIETVRKKGYDIVLWCDSVLQLTRPLDAIIPEVEELGVYLAEDGWKCGQFVNDNALRYFGVTRDEAMKISSIWACFMGFDFRKPVTSVFFQKWKDACAAGAFRGHWNNLQLTESQDPRCKGHRHDQSCAELISYQMKIPRGKAVLHPDPDYTHRYFRGREW